MLSMKNISGGYEHGYPVLKELSLRILQDQTVAVIGSNGSGKSTLARAIIGQLPYLKGSISLNGKDITNTRTHNLPELGIGYFTQGGRVFRNLTVYENLRLAGLTLSNRDSKSRISAVQMDFPFLTERKNLSLMASNLSGGERNQLALAMAVLNSPQLLILDEPSAGLSPALTSRLYELIQNIKSAYHPGILLIEQNVKEGIRHADETYVIRDGKLHLNHGI